MSRLRVNVQIMRQSGQWRASGGVGAHPTALTITSGMIGPGGRAPNGLDHHLRHDWSLAAELEHILQGGGRLVLHQLLRQHRHLTNRARGEGICSVWEPMA
eukprot:1179963-Prorocentrum_minimum.AAC.2